MAVANTTPITKNFTSNEIDYSASFNGKVYNGKRYINVSYRLNNTKSGLKQYTAIWQDGFGWTDCRLNGDTLVDLFDLQ